MKLFAVRQAFSAEPSRPGIPLSVWLLALVSAIVLVRISFGTATASVPKKPSTGQVTARPGKTSTARFENAGNRRINLSGGSELLTSYEGSQEAISALDRNEATPLAAVSDDFDEDGVPDLVCAYRSPTGGMLALHRGNVDSIYPNAPDARQRRAQGEFTDAPFLSPAYVFELAEQPDFVGAGDFDADDHRDLITARIGGNALWFSSGDGHGGFAEARQIRLPGAVTAMTVGEINRRDGLADIVVGITSTSGAKALVLESPLGAAGAQPEEFALPAPASALALGEIVGSYEQDLAIAAGNQLIVLTGRDRKLSFEADNQSPVERAEVSSRSFEFNIKSLVIGNFRGDNHTDIAMLGDDGRVRISRNPTPGSSKQRKTTLAGWRTRALETDQWPLASEIVRARVSSNPTDNLLVLDTENHRVSIIDQQPEVTSRKAGVKTLASSAGGPMVSSLASDSEPVAVLAMRLNSGALSGLVMLSRGRSSPSIVFPAVAMTFTVDNVGDTSDANLGDGVCDDGGGNCTLRAAIQEANANAGADTINISIGAGAQTISPAADLPSISEAITIDGTTQPGFAGTPIIEIDCTNVTNGVVVNSGNSTIRGLVINRAPGPGRGVIQLQTGGNNIIEGNFIGTDISGTAALANNSSGVFAFGSSGNRIGGTVAASRNLISGNIDGLFFIFGSSGNVVQGNLIGTDITGTTAIGNGVSGVGAGPIDNNQTIGGTAAGARNVISANNGPGINLNGSGSLIQGNLVGTDSSGAAALGNNSGIALLDNTATGNTVGGVTAAARNVVSGNIFDGVSIAINAVNNLIQGNFIGTLADGTTPMPNTSDGINFDSSSSNNSIGGTVAGARNIIAFNGGRGINAISGTGNGFLANSIFSNGGLGIDLNGDGVTPNDAGDADAGPNNLQNFPVLTSATPGAMTTIQGTLNSTPNTTFRVEFFSNPACDPSGNGEGTTFLGFTGVMIDGSGNATINVTLPVSVPAGNVVVATATDPSNNTSEFSACITVAPAACTITCPPNQTASTAANQCGVTVNYPAPTTTGSCGGVSCTPPSGSFFSVGTTTITCTTGVGPTCSFSVTVVDDKPPLLACPQNLLKETDAGKATAMIDYVSAVVSDNCPGATVVCLPPSGFTAPLGTTTVICTAKDASNNAASCSFTVTVTDSGPPSIRCPASFSVEIGPNQTSAVVNYPPPVVSDNLSNAMVVCAPPSGAIFPLGVTTVSCMAKDSGGNQVSCGFAITVFGGAPAGRIIIPGGQPMLEFGAGTPVTVNRKPPKSRKLSCGLFSIENTSLAPLRLTLDSINRIGSEVDAGRISDAAEGNLYQLSEVLSDGSLAPVEVGSTMTIAVGAQKNFCLKFGPSVPSLAGTTTGLRAPQAIPDVVNSRVSFSLAGAGPLTANVMARVETALMLINPNKPKKPPVISFSSSGDEFIASFAVFDSNMDVSKASYELLRANGQVAAGPFDIDLAQPIRGSNLVRGQSFSIEQRFTGARGHPEIKGVRVTVFDSETNVVGSTTLKQSSAVSVAQIGQQGGSRIVLPVVVMHRPK